MDLTQQLLATKKEYLVPCVYHFYQRPPVLVRGEGAISSIRMAVFTSTASAVSL